MASNACGAYSIFLKVFLEKKKKGQRAIFQLKGVKQRQQILGEKLQGS